MILYTPENSYIKEMVKHEQRDSWITAAAQAPPGRPYRFEPFPKMLYKAERRENGKVECMSANRTPEEEQFSARCSMIANNEVEETRAMESGWRHSIKEALEFIEAKEQGFARAAAERAYAESRMSEKAQAEAKAFDATTPEHVAVIPETPIKRRGGRPRKVNAEA